MNQQDERLGGTSASSAEADLLCPGRHLAQKGLQPFSTPDSEFGTRIHDALAKRNPEDLTIEEIEVYEACIEIERKVVLKFFGELPEGKLISFPENRMFATVQENANGTVFNFPHSAKSDRVYRFGTVGLIIEYKTLSGDVPDSPRNLQLRDQAVLARGAYLLNQIGVVVIQPFVTHDPEICLYKDTELKQAEAEMFQRVRASNDGRSARVPGQVQCKFCLAAKRGTCLEYNRWSGGMVPAMSALLDIVPSQWSPENRQLFCDRFDTAQKWLNDCWAAMEEGAKSDPNFVPGYSMVPGAEQVTITNPQLVFERFLKLGGTAQLFMEAVKVVKTPLMKEVKEITGEVGKKLEARMKELIAGATESKRNKSSLRKVDK